MIAKKYIADLTAGSLLLAESQIIAPLLLSGCSKSEWKQEIVERNILQKRSGQTAIRYAGIVRKRLEPLGKEFISELINSHDALYRQMLFLATVINTPVIADFMLEVVGESHRVYLKNLKKDVWPIFIDPKFRVIEGLDKISEATIKKSGFNVIKILVEAGYLNNSKEKVLQPVYLLPEIKRWLSILGRDDLEAVMECTV